HISVLAVRQSPSAHPPVRHSPAAGIGGKPQHGLSCLIHYLSSSHSPIRPFFQLEFIVTRNPISSHNNFLFLLIRNGICFHGDFIPIRFYLHPIILYPTAPVPVLKRIDFQRFKIHQAERNCLFLFVFPFAELQRFQHFIQAFLTEMSPDCLCFHLIILRKCYLYGSHCASEITFCGINNFSGISKTCRSSIFPIHFVSVFFMAFQAKVQHVPVINRDQSR